MQTKTIDKLEDLKGYEWEYNKKYFKIAHLKLYVQPAQPEIHGLNLIQINALDFHGNSQDETIRRIGEKTTLVHATLENGFTITKTSACVDPENYDQKIGAEICLEHIKNEVWYLLGFLLQQRVHESKFVDVAGGC